LLGVFLFTGFYLPFFSLAQCPGIAFQEAVIDNTQCGGQPANGSITVKATSGRSLAGGGYRYSLVSPAAFAATNTSGEFSNLPKGTYTIRAYDSCGNFQSRNITVANAVDKYNPIVASIERVSCDKVNAALLLQDSSGGAAYYTIYTNYSYGYYEDGGNFSGYRTLARPGFDVINISRDTCTIFIKDPCGNVNKLPVTTVGNFSYGGFIGTLANAVTTSASCVRFNANFRNHLYSKGTRPVFTITCAPDPSLVGQTSNTGVFTDLPYGDYCYRITDDCGRSKTFTFSSSYAFNIPFSSLVMHECTGAYGTVTLSGPYNAGTTLQLEVIDSIVHVRGNTIKRYTFDTITPHMLLADSLPAGKDIYFRFSNNCGNVSVVGPYKFGGWQIDRAAAIKSQGANKADISLTVTNKSAFLKNDNAISSVITNEAGLDYGIFDFDPAQYTSQTFVAPNLRAGKYIIKTFNTACTNVYYADTLMVLPTPAPAHSPRVIVPVSAYLNTVNVAPNPFNAQLTLHLNSKTAFRATVSMYDARGRLVLAEDWEITHGQNQKIITPKSMLPNGIYHIRITTPGNELIFKSSVLKQ